MSNERTRQIWEALTGCFPPDEPVGGSPGGGEPADIDLSAAPVVAAIAAAVQQANEAAAQREAGLVAKRDELLGEVKGFKALGANADDLKTRLAEIEQLRTQLEAKEAGGDPDKYADAVEAAAQRKYEVRSKELDDVVTAKADRVTELEAANAELAKLAHRHFVGREVLRAAMPKDTRIVQEGAWDYLIDTLAPTVVEHQVEGLGTVARLKVNDVLVPGGGPDSLMDLTELLAQARQGKGPIPNIGFCFVSAGKGSDTSPPTPSPTGLNWWKMTEPDRDKYIQEKGSEAAKDLVEASGPEPAPN